MEAAINRYDVHWFRCLSTSVHGCRSSQLVLASLPKHQLKGSIYS